MISAIVPAYNEEGCIIEFAARLYISLKTLKEPFEIIFMVGGTDNTHSLLVDWREKLECSNIWIIYEKERGLGTAITKGIAFIHRHADWTLTIDADLQQLPEEIRLLWKRRHFADLIIGSKGKIDSRKWYKRVLSKLLYGLYRYTHGIPIRDMGSNFRLYSRTLLTYLPLEEAPLGYKFQQWAILKAWSAGFEIIEVPTTFNPRTTGTSKLSIWSEVWERLISMFRLSGLRIW